MIELQDLCGAVAANTSGLRITAGGSRPYPYDALAELPELAMSGYSGVIDYHPEELVIRVRSGTRLVDLNAELTEQGQMLASEPPVHGQTSTIGGAVAAGLSGSRRPYSGATRDFVLGVGLILSDGQYSEFGGQVMKNVAGYDVARLVCGSFGILGPIADVSLKVLPRPETEKTAVLEMGLDQAMQTVKALRRRVSGLSACAYLDGQLWLRFSGREAAVNQELTQLGGANEGNDFWQKLDSLQLPGFETADIWRLSTDGDESVDMRFDLLDWGFTQRWLINPDSDPRSQYSGTGHWTRMQMPEGRFAADVFHPLPEVQSGLMQSLKEAFDPNGIFNPDRMYPGV